MEEVLVSFEIQSSTDVGDAGNFHTAVICCVEDCVMADGL